MITVITLSRPSHEAPEILSNWTEIPEAVKALILSADDIERDYNEFLVYTGKADRKLLASCTIVNEDAGKLEIEDCWTGNGNLWE